MQTAVHERCDYFCVLTVEVNGCLAFIVCRMPITLQNTTFILSLLSKENFLRIICMMDVFQLNSISEVEVQT